MYAVRHDPFGEDGYKNWARNRTSTEYTHPTRAPLNGAPLNGAPLNGAPLNGAPLSGAHH